MKGRITFSALPALAGFALLAGLALACHSNPEASRGDVTTGNTAQQGDASGWRGAREGDWLSWRGAGQTGASSERGLPDTVDPAQPLWSLPLKGRGTPVIADGRVYVTGYVGESETLREKVMCLDERDGSTIWEKTFRDPPTDTVYSRYAVSSPTVDPENGNVYFQTTGGLLIGVTRDGEELWQRALVEEFGKLTFPNGRTGAPLVDEGRVIIHMINVTWGKLGPARDRFYAFDKLTGECLWSSTPGLKPIDNSFCMPYVEERGGKRVLYAVTGCGHVVCIDVRTGDPLWRFRMATGGANASVSVLGDTLIAIHGGENLDTSTQGRLVAFRIPATPAAAPDGPLDLAPETERWRQEVGAFSSSPALAGERIYLTDEGGELVAVNASTGELLWKYKLAADQVHASPLHADGKLYVPMNNGSFHIIRPHDSGPEMLCSVQLSGNCMGQPSAANGRVFVFTTERLYCFGGEGARDERGPMRVAAPAGSPAPGKAVRLQVVPADGTVRVGEAFPFRVRALDASGRVVREVEAGQAQFDQPDALDIEWGMPGTLRATAQTVGILRVEADGLEGAARVRSVPTLPYQEDFEGIALTREKGGVQVGRAPGSWFGSGPKWDVREKDGSKVLARVMDNPLFQRTVSLMGHPDDSNYTMQVDVCSDGNRRTMSNVGVIHQRYVIELKGNHQEIEISSNVEALKVTAPFRWKAGKWYTLKTRVDLLPNGSGIVRARAWPRGEAEPTDWTIEVPHPDAHTHGAPGLFGFTPQSRFKVYLDNLTITPAQ